MEEKQINLSELKEGWDRLYYEIRKTKRIDFDIFTGLYADTYALLLEEANKEQVDKKYLGLIASAFLFANAESKEMESKFRAALALTERMLTCCAFRITPDLQNGTNIYIFEVRKDVYLNFGNVTESISTLEKLFDDEYWRSL